MSISRSVLPEFIEGYDNPLDCIVDILIENIWTFDRISDDRLDFHLEDESQTGFKFRLVWDQSAGVLHSFCESEYTVDKKQDGFAELCMQANSGLWMGHFCLSDKNRISFRHSGIFTGVTASGIEYLKIFVEAAMTAFNQYQAEFSLVSDKKDVPEDIANDNNTIIDDEESLSELTFAAYELMMTKTTGNA